MSRSSQALARPHARPHNPCFSTGPTAKPPGHNLAQVSARALLGRSHRSTPAKAQLAELIQRSHRLLGLPDDWKLAIVPGSDTGAFEMALWNLVADPRGAEVLVWESFSSDWAKDVIGELGLKNARLHEAPYGGLPSLDELDPARDWVFAWNGTTSGVRVPNGDWIPANREGLTLCDATSAVFAMPLPYDKLDVVTWSWQKALGGEAAHGMLALSPRAQARLEAEAAPRPLPKLFRLCSKGKLNAGLFEGATLNTPSMLAVADCLATLDWAESLGLDGLMARSDANRLAVDTWLTGHAHFAWLPEDPATRSSTALCIKFSDPAVIALPLEQQQALAKALVKLLETEGVAYDLGAYRTAPPGLRLWGGPTVEPDDMAALLPWIDWAYASLSPRFLA